MNQENQKTKFGEINVSEEIVRAISDMGFEEMSPIQAQAIPLLLEGYDVIGQAQTGTGKTTAFGIPIIEKVDTENSNVQAIVLCPTRELSIQVAEEMSRLAKYKTGVRILPIYGGQPIDRQIKTLKKGVQIVIGTPGRVIDHIKRRTLRTDNINMFVLDEADEMFDMGFRDDIELVVNHLKNGYQSLFFSATMAKSIMDFAKTYQNDPKVIKIVRKEMTVPKVDQIYYDLTSHVKTEVLSRVLDIYNPKLSVVFCNTKRKVDELIGELQARGFFADGLHGDLKQGQRDSVMGKFRKGTIDVLVATDVAARGIDVNDIDLVVNYDMPQDDEDYVHRIGRTARAGRSGLAISFVTNRDFGTLKGIQRFTQTTIERKPLPTIKDITEKQTSKFLEKIRDIIEKQNLEKQINVISMLQAEDYNAVDIAAAILKLHKKATRSGVHQEIDSVDNNNRAKYNSRDSKGKRGEYGKRDSRDSRDFKGKRGDKQSKPKEYNTKNVSRLYINTGRKKGVSERHILSALCQDGGISSSEVGNIDIYDKFTFVDVNKKVVDQVVTNLNNKSIKGSKVLIEKAKD